MTCHLRPVYKLSLNLISSMTCSISFPVTAHYKFYCTYRKIKAYQDVLLFTTLWPNYYGRCWQVYIKGSFWRKKFIGVTVLCRSVVKLSGREIQDDRMTKYSGTRGLRRPHGANDFGRKWQVVVKHRFRSKGICQCDQVYTNVHHPTRTPINVSKECFLQ